MVPLTLNLASDLKYYYETPVDFEKFKGWLDIAFDLFKNGSIVGFVDTALVDKEEELFKMFQAHVLKWFKNDIELWNKDVDFVTRDAFKSADFTIVDLTKSYTEEEFEKFFKKYPKLEKKLRRKAAKHCILPEVKFFHNQNLDQEEEEEEDLLPCAQPEPPLTPPSTPPMASTQLITPSQEKKRRREIVVPETQLPQSPDYWDDPAFFQGISQVMEDLAKEEEELMKERIAKMKKLSSTRGIF